MPERAYASLLGRVSPVRCVVCRLSAFHIRHRLWRCLNGLQALQGMPVFARLFLQARQQTEDGEGAQEDQADGEQHFDDQCAAIRGAEQLLRRVEMYLHACQPGYSQNDDTDNDPWGVVGQDGGERTRTLL